MKQVVNTEGIADSASDLRTVNNNINNAYSRLVGKAIALDHDWDSPAGETARRALVDILKKNEVRSAVLNNYINLLEKQVNPNYLSAEFTNTLLSDKFK